jgi:serine/threonine protein kinase
MFDLVVKSGMPFPEPLSKYLFKQLLGAVDYLHTDAQIVHRDIKFENLLLNSDFKI